MASDLLIARDFHPSVLLVEDEAATAQAIIAILQKRFPVLHVDFASSLEQAEYLLAQTKQTKDFYSAVILDDRIPLRHGDAPSNSESLCSLTMRTNQRTAIVHVSAFAEDPAVGRHWSNHRNAAPITHILLGKSGADWVHQVLAVVEAAISQNPPLVLPYTPDILATALDFEHLLRATLKDPRELLQLNPRQFEEFVADLWNRFGYKVELTKRTRDGGRDIIAVRRSEADLRLLVECKRYDVRQKVGVGLVRSLYGVKQHELATKAILATTSTFTKDAQEFFEAHKWELEPRDQQGILDWVGRAASISPTSR
jgi:CheY-like chemotaxis protein